VEIGVDVADRQAGAGRMAEFADGYGLIDVLDRVLDKGVVIDAHVRIGVAGIEVIAVEARVVVASIETYLAHAEAISYTAPAAPPRLPEQSAAAEPPLLIEAVTDTDPATAPPGAPLAKIPPEKQS
jgi:gas vesicle structural protein